MRLAFWGVLHFNNLGEGRSITRLLKSASPTFYLIEKSLSNLGECMNWKRFFVVMFALLVSVLATNRPVWSQATVNSGNIQGTVTDAQGGVVANATVTDQQ